MAKSRAIAARLHPKHEEEAQALSIADYFLSQGYDMRTIVTNGLLSLAETEGLQVTRTEDNDAPLLAMLREMMTLLREIKAGGVVSNPQLYEAVVNETGDNADFLSMLAQSGKRSYRERNS